MYTLDAFARPSCMLLQHLLSTTILGRTMSTWVTATIDNTGETIYLNLDHAAQMERRGPHATYTAIQFVVPELMATVRETPETLINQIGARFSEPQ